jgi:hypothetical protein
MKTAGEGSLASEHELTKLTVKIRETLTCLIRRSMVREDGMEKLRKDPPNLWRGFSSNAPMVLAR